MGTSPDFCPVRLWRPMCSIRSGVGGTHRRLDHLSVTGPFAKYRGLSQRPDRKTGIRGARDLKGLLDQAERQLLGNRLTSPWPDASSTGLQEGHGAADVRHPDQHAKETLLKVPLLTVVSYLARPDSFGRIIPSAWWGVLKPRAGK